MNISLQIDLPLFSTIIPLILVVYMRQNDSAKDYASRLFLQLLIVSFAVSLVDVIAWLPNGVDSPLGRILNRWGNILYFALCTLPPFVWVRYFDYKITNDRDGLRRRSWLYAIPTFIGWLLLPVNEAYGIVFYLTAANEYVRGPFNAVYLFLNYSLLLAASPGAIRHWRHISGRLIQVLMFFVLLPIIGAAIQQYYYGVTLTYPLLNLAALLAFLYLEKDAMLKDALTGLNTRSQLESRLTYKLKREVPFSLIMIDLNDFKRINDDFGHDVGDHVLSTVASILETHVKREDMVCRYGGDEFTVLVESPAPEVGPAMVKRLEEALETYNEKEISPFRITMSLGVIHVEENTNINSLLRRVDRAMYTDKARRKERSAGA